MYKVTDIQFEPCRVTEKDAKNIMEWRNDPTTLSMFFHSEPKVWENFWPEFQNTYFTCPITPLFAVLDNQRIGFLKFSTVTHPKGLNATTVDISINIAPHIRGKGLGPTVLQAALEYLHKQGVQTIYAEILVKNTASIKTFEKVGFTFIEEKNKTIQDTGQTHRIKCYGSGYGF